MQQHGVKIIMASSIDTNSGTGGQRFGREQAWELLTEWTVSESLRKHAVAVEICVSACGEAEADRLGLSGAERAELLELYAATALLHDFDYERHPTAGEQQGNRFSDLH